MIVKPNIISHFILQMEALAQRLPWNHPLKEQITGAAKRLRAGFNGEKALEFPLSYLPYDDSLIFFHLRIPDHDSDKCFQIDVLLLFKYFLLIIEAKNIDGTVLYDDMDQSIRQKDDKEDVFNNPVYQVNLQHLRLLRWLREFDFPPIPIEKVVVYSNTNTLLKNLSTVKNLTDIVIRKEKLLSKVNQLIKKHQTPCLSEEQLLKLSDALLAADTPEEANAMEKNNIRKEDILKGVFCPECGSLPMKWVHGKWNCMHCRTTSKTAHKKALKDYCLLFGEYISNREAREFLQLDSIDTTKRLLNKEDLEKFGFNSGRKYRLDCLLYDEE